MNIPKAVTKDSHGALTSVLQKLGTETCVSAEVLYDDARKPVLSINYNNIDYRSIITDTGRGKTYGFVLSYMGTMGRKQLYSQVVVEDNGKLNAAEPPEFKYSVDGLYYTQDVKPDDVVLNINFYTGEANILQFKGVPVGGNNPPFQSVYKYSYSYPFTMNSLPNRSGVDSFFDGWYNAIYVIFNDVLEGNQAIKGDVYGYAGEWGLASASGTFGINNNDELVILDYAGNITLAFDLDSTYEEKMLAIGRLEGNDTFTVGMMADSQILVTEEINNAIVTEIRNIACDPACDDACTIADWQKLQQKRLGAYINFIEGEFRKAQVILESARKSCSINSKSC